MNPPIIMFHQPQTLQMSRHPPYHSRHPGKSLYQGHVVDPAGRVHGRWVVSHDRVEKRFERLDPGKGDFV
jgi:hypothetical protein